MPFGIIDEYQGKGIWFVALMRHIAAIAARRLRELVAEVLADNVAMLKVFERSGLRHGHKARRLRGPCDAALPVDDREPDPERGPCHIAHLIRVVSSAGSPVGL